MPHGYFLFLDESLLVANSERYNLSILASDLSTSPARIYSIESQQHTVVVEAEDGRFDCNLRHHLEVQFLNVSEENL